MCDKSRLVSDAWSETVCTRHVDVHVLVSPGQRARLREASKAGPFASHSVRTRRKSAGVAFDQDMSTSNALCAARRQMCVIVCVCVYVCVVSVWSHARDGVT